MRAAFGIGLLMLVAEAKKKTGCCSALGDGCGKKCALWSTSDWCNESEDNCNSCGHWCGRWEDIFEVEESNDMSALNVTELVEGILIGALEKQKVDDVDACLQDINPLVTTMTAAVKDFEDGGFSKICKGIDELGHFISDVATAMENCEAIATGDDVTKLKSMADVFLHPKKLVWDSAKNVLLNGVSIYDDIKAADSDLDAGNYEEAGKQFGTMAATVLYGGDNLEFVQ